jgi:hypothetical protein
LQVFTALLRNVSDSLFVASAVAVAQAAVSGDGPIPASIRDHVHRYGAWSFAWRQYSGIVGCVFGGIGRSGSTPTQTN